NRVGGGHTLTCTRTNLDQQRAPPSTPVSHLSVPRARPPLASARDSGPLVEARAALRWHRRGRDERYGADGQGAGRTGDRIRSGGVELYPAAAPPRGRARDRP